VIHHNFIQVGDIIQIERGKKVPVDGVILEGYGVLTDESAMTGESDQMKKESLEICKQRLEEKEQEYSMQAKPKKGHHDLPSSILLSGTNIETGQGLYMAIVIGPHSCLRKIIDSLGEGEIETTAL
jgi:magnesium-transporting ATPase (P-type)